MKLSITFPFLLLLLQLTIVAEQKPNILFIFADDHAFDCVASHGNKEIKTPNLDRLTSNGVHFSHAYNPGAWGGAVCVASRAMLMSGKFVGAAEKFSWKKALADKKVFPQRVKAQGYTTYFTGKWHTRVSVKGSYDHVLHKRGGMPNQTKARYSRNFEPGQDDWSPSDPKYGGFWKGGKHWSEVVADDGLKFLEMAKEDKKPFFINLFFNAPHDPRQAPQEYQDMYPYENISIPVNFQSKYPHLVGSNGIRDENLAPHPRTKHSIRVNRSEYYALITHMDAQIGRVLDALEKSGQADNTYIIFTADHGLSVGHHGFIGKQNMYDPAVRVPWIITGPNVPKGKKISEKIYLQSAMATCLDIAGADQKDIEFDSVLPIIRGEKKGLGEVLGYYTNDQRSVQKFGFKYILYPKIKVEKLFKVSTDPWETKNVISNPEYEEILKKLRAIQKENDFKFKYDAKQHHVKH